MFRRRFAILTASGKLYSFRRADLGKPDSIHLTQASLVWDIRGCTVELAPKLGKGTWVLKPTGANLKEEIYLRVCSFSKSSTTENWMNVMLAVARNNLHALFDSRRVSLLHVSVATETRSDEPLYVEVEGSVSLMKSVPDTEIPTFTAQIFLRDPHPGSCLMICQYSSAHLAGEQPVRKSSLIPRYTFHKSKTSLPWTTLRPMNIQLAHDVEQSLSLSCTLEVRIDEHLRAYASPLVSRFIDDEGLDSLDFSVFKFQIRRLIRLIEKIGRIRQQITDIFEWKHASTSACWLVYLTIIILVIPRIIPTLILGHALYYSLLNSVEFRTWMMRITGSGIILASGTETQTVPTAPVSTSFDSDPSTMSPKTRAKTAVRETAMVALQQIQSVIGKHASNQGSVLRPEIWENQRRVLGGSQFSASNLSVFDRSRWSNVDGTIALEPPSSSEWKIDVDAANSDDNGWTYNIRWGASDWHASYSTWDLVRRRRWIPINQGSMPAPRATESGSSIAIQTAAQPIPITTAEDAQEPVGSESNASPNVASLSGVVTSGPEFGNIREDYDDSNAEHQPKQSGFGSMFNEFKQTANVAQLEIGRICADFEKYMNLFSWRDEMISTVASAGLALLVLVSMFVPINIIVYVILVGQFTVGYRRRKWRQVAVDTILTQHVLPVLPTGTLRGLGGLDAHKLCLTLSKRTGFPVTQKLLAAMDSPEMLAVWICKQSKAFTGYRTWMKRDFVENFLDHVPPEVSEENQEFFRDFCHQSWKELHLSTSPNFQPLVSPPTMTDNSPTE